MIFFLGGGGQNTLFFRYAYDCMLDSVQVVHVNGFSFLFFISIIFLPLLSFEIKILFIEICEGTF